MCMTVGKENVLAELNHKKIWSENVLKPGSKEVLQIFRQGLTVVWRGIHYISHEPRCGLKGGEVRCRGRSVGGHGNVPGDGKMTEFQVNHPFELGFFSPWSTN